MRTRGVCALLSLVVLATLTAPLPALAGEEGKGATAPQSDEASERFRSGVEFYKDKDFTAALVEFKRAYELAPNYRVLFNLGQTSRELRDHATALLAFEQYLSEGGKEIAAGRRKDVQGWIDELKKKVGTMTVVTNVEGAEILVDDVSVGRTPLERPVVVNVGRRKFSATLSGYTPTQRAVDVAGLDQKTVELELEKIEKDDVRRAPDPPKPPPKIVEAETPVAAWVAFSATAACAVVTGTMAGLAMSARGDLDDALGVYPGDPAAIDDAQGRTRTFALATDILGGVTIAGAITTVVLFIVAPGPTEEPAVSLGVSPTGIVVRGAF